MMFSHDLLKSKVVLVTGASRGIGRGIAIALGKVGATVIGTATTEEGAVKITQGLQDEKIMGSGMALNETDQNSVEQCITSIKEQFGAVNILINNAAVTQDNLFLRMKDEEWLSVIETNLTSLYRLTKACMRDMIKARYGRVINIGSVVGSTGNKGQANYAAAKAGMIGFTKSIALEVGSRNITLNIVSPGFIGTDMTHALTEAQRTSIFERIPMQRMGTIDDIASAVLFLASDAAGYITGQTIHVNGGMYMNS